MRPAPLDNGDDLLRVLDNLSLNQTVARTSSRQYAGGAPVMTRSRRYANASHSHKFGGVMAVEGRDIGFEDEEWEFQRKHAVMLSRGGFGRNNSEPDLYIRYASLEAKDASRRAFGPRRLNCAEY